MMEFLFEPIERADWMTLTLLVMLTGWYLLIMAAAFCFVWDRINRKEERRNAYRSTGSETAGDLPGVDLRAVPARLDTSFQAREARAKGGDPDCGGGT